MKKKEIDDLRAAHRTERNRNAAYKINAIILLGTGWILKNVKSFIYSPYGYIFLNINKFDPLLLHHSDIVSRKLAVCRYDR